MKRQQPTSFTAGRKMALPARPARTVINAATATNTALTSATAAFSSPADVGAAVVGAGIPAATTIVSVTNATTVVLNHATTATAAGVTVTITPVAKTYSVGQSIPGSVVKALKYLSALLSRRWIIPNLDPSYRKTKSSTPTPTSLSTRERAKL